MTCPHEVKCCHYCPCHYLACKRCQTHSLLSSVFIPKHENNIRWGCPKCGAWIPYKKEDLNKFRLIKR